MFYIIILHVPSLGERAGRDANANNCYKGDGHSCISQVRQSENIIGSVRGRSDWLMLDASFVYGQHTFSSSSYNFYHYY